MANFVNVSYLLNWDGMADTTKYIRISASQIGQMIRDGQIAIAWKSSADPNKEIVEDIIGCVSVELIRPSIGDLGLLTCHTAHRGAGVGQQLVEFAEDWARSLGAEEMQLEILIPDG